MSVSVQALLWKLRLPATEKLVAIRLGDFASDDGTRVFPAVQTVAEECGITDRAVQITIKKLLTAGILVQLSDGRGGRGRTTEYAFDLDRVHFLIENPEQASPIKNPEKGENSERNSPFIEETPNVVRKTPNDVHPNHYEPPLPDADDMRATIRKRLVSVGLQVLRLIGVADDPRWFGDYGRVAQWLADGADPDLDIFPTIQRVMARRGSRGPPGNLSYFDGPIADAIASRTKPIPEGKSHVQQFDRSRASSHEALFAGFSQAAGDYEDARNLYR